MTEPDLFAITAGGKINPAFNGTGCDFYAEDRDLGSVLITMTLGEVEALRDRMESIAKQIRERQGSTK